MNGLVTEAESVFGLTSASSFYLKAAKYISISGGVAAVAITVYGVAASIFPFIVMGAIFVATSLINFYLLHQMVDLKAIEAVDQKIETLEKSLSQETKKNEQLTTDIDKTSKAFASLGKQYEEKCQQDLATEQKHIQELKKVSETTKKTEEEAASQLEKEQAKLKVQIEKLQEQINKDVATIQDLKQTNAVLKVQNLTFQTSSALLHKHIESYQAKLKEHEKLNSDLQGKVNALSSALKTPEPDISALTAHAELIEKAIANQNMASDKLTTTAAQLHEALNTLQGHLKTAQPGK